MTRFDDLGLAGYERGTGYRPDGFRQPGLNRREVLGALVWLALVGGACSLLWDKVGAPAARLAMWLSVAVLWCWRGWRDRRHPLAADAYATDEERGRIRRDSAWSFVVAAIWVGMAVAMYVHDSGHGR
ncbi:MAG: hypothetical protein JO013_01310 [Alphaproteobacteria bacterium]|nr:hypothetical protein [Alphaproteobacteria bacterium]